jgi:hypothetical protein
MDDEGLSRAMQVLVHVAEASVALQYIHSMGIVHRGACAVAVLCVHYAASEERSCPLCKPIFPPIHGLSKAFHAFISMRHDVSATMHREMIHSVSDRRGLPPCMCVCADIKPDNMLLDGDGHVHLADFNVASYIPDSGLLRSRAGTRPYMGMSRASEARGATGS